MKVKKRETQIERVEAMTPDLARERVEELRRVFPDAFTEGRVDFARLHSALGDSVETRAERYLFSWAGKRDCVKLLQTPSRATLKPCAKESIAFETTQNVFIEGENLETLKLLYKSYFGRVKMIYIDPPYNTGNDFVYRDNYAAPLEEYLRATGQRDENGDLATSKVETSGRFHSNWLSMIYPRLFMARQLLRDDGVIFVSIDDNEVHNLRMVMNEIFGEENFLGNILWKKKTNGNNMGYIPPVHDFIVAYAKQTSPSVLFEVPLPNAYLQQKYSNPDNDARGDWTTTDLSANHVGPYFAILNPNTGEEFLPPEGRYWVFSEEEVQRRIAEERIIFGRNGKGRPIQKKFKSEMSLSVKAESWWDNIAYNADATQELGELLGVKMFDNPKPSKLIKYLMQVGLGKSDIILDFFAGSCTTAQAVLELNREDGGTRRFVCVQLPEPTPKNSPARKAKFKTIADIGKERVARVIARMKAERAARLPRRSPEDLGFRVFRLDESNIRAWQPMPPDVSAEDYAKQLEMMIDPLVDGWRAEDVIWEVALKEGYELSSRIEAVATEAFANRVYRVTDAEKEQTFWICLDDHINQNLPVALGFTRQNLFICRDAALNDTLAANLALQCRLKTI